MSIQQMVVYNGQVDKIFGLVDMGPGSEQDAMAAPQMRILHVEKTGNAPSSSESSILVSLPAENSDVPALPLVTRSAARERSSELE
ncbi:hypothetical protein MRX96_031075 [Rhipicephalus microplus]